MSLVSRATKQDAVWWPLASRDMVGTATYGTPQAVKVRWEAVDSEVHSEAGAVIQCQVSVMMDYAWAEARGVKVGDLLWLGAIGTYAGSSTNPLESEAVEIQAMDVSPNFKNSWKLLIVRA